VPASSTGAGWRWAGLAAFVLLGASYARLVRLGLPRGGGSSAGVAYGVLGAAAILVLLFFGARKRWYKSVWGRLESWLQSHIWLGLLAGALIACHAGFHFRDRLAIAAFMTLLVVVGSGIWGVVLYRQVPRLLTEVETGLTAAEASEQLNQLARAMARVAAGRSAELGRVHQSLLAQSRPGRLAGWRILRPASGRAGRERGSGKGDRRWAEMVGRVGPAEQADLRQLLVLSRQREELRRRLLDQQRYKNLLDVWLYLHVPLSIALVALVVAHVVAVLYYWQR
jgi:hypothetical protein